MICSSCDRDVVVTVVLVNRPRSPLQGTAGEVHLCRECYAPAQAVTLAEIKPRRAAGGRRR